ncbi:MAG: CusA/CzcA family heavy metal efflux RND transporter [Myxococcota bacterium]|nr:CusA/CzcA family heavy metal efflux RND transporter [Myxococcota bacterium]
MNNAVRQIIALSAKKPWMILILFFGLILLANRSLQQSSLDALPDLSDPQVIILSNWSGQSPDRMEEQVSQPVSSALLSLPNVESIRSQSFFGLSFVYAIFEEDTDIYWARSRVQEKLSTLQLPEEVHTQLGPDATGSGWILSYVLTDKTGNQDLATLRDIQEWNLRYALESVEGVAEVASIGGRLRSFEIVVDPNALRAYDLSLQDLATAIRQSNRDVGGQTLEIAGHSHMIRGKGRLASLADLRTILVALLPNGGQVLLEDVAAIQYGSEPERGIAEWNGLGEVVGGTIIMRYEENALQTIQRVKDRIQTLEQGLPEGVNIEIAYDRSQLIERSIQTLQFALLEEMLIVALVVMVFLGQLRPAVVIVIGLPVAVLLSFIPFQSQGLTLNIMSLGGIAVAIGAMVDASIIMVENITRKSKKDIVASMQEVGPSIFISLLLIAVAFLPVFALEGVEGRLFRPLAFGKSYAMLAASLVSITLIPALAVLFLKKRSAPPRQLEDRIRSLYVPVVRFCTRSPWISIGGALLAMISTIPVFLQLESEFMPPLNEGDILYMPSAPPGIGHTEAGRVLQTMDAQIVSHPQVKSVFGKMGRMNSATDPAPLGMAEITIQLTDPSTWPTGTTFDSIVADLDAKVQIPGMPNIWWMPIQTRTEMLSTGVRAPLALQVFGPDLDAVQAAGLALEKRLAGLGSVIAERNDGAFYVDIELNPLKAQKWGVRTADIQDAIAMAVGGKKLDDIIIGHAKYGVRVRYAQDFRDTPESLDDVLVNSPLGPVPLEEVTDIHFVKGPPMLRTESAQSTGFVFIDPQGKAISEFVAQAEEKLTGIRLPEGVRYLWVGQYKHLVRAQETLLYLIPITLLLITVLLYQNTGSWIETGIVMLAVPFSLVGAFWILYLLDFQLSVAVWVGILALAGLDAEMGVVMLLYLKIAYRDRKGSLEDAIIEGAAHRLRPKLMTVLSTSLALTPILWSSGTGADVMKRMAAPMVGGLASSFLLELLVYPSIFYLWKRSEEKKNAVAS